MEIDTSGEYARLVLLAERHDGQSEVGVVGRQERSSAEVVAGETSNDTSGATSSLKSGVTGVVKAAEEDESEPEPEDEVEERNGASGRSNEVNGGDSEPDPQEKSDGTGLLRGVGRGSVVQVGLTVVCSAETKEGNQNHSEAPPEAAERNEYGGTKSVTAGKLPESGQELTQTSVRKRKSDNRVGDRNVDNANVEQGKQERRG